MLPFPDKFLVTFFSHRPQISNFPPIFAVSIHFPPVSQKLFVPPTFTHFPPCFRQIHLLFTYFTCIFPPTLTMMHLCITQCTYWTPLVLYIKNPGTEAQPDSHVRRHYREAGCVFRQLSIKCSVSTPSLSTERSSCLTWRRRNRSR